MSVQDFTTLQGAFGAAILSTKEFRGEFTVNVALEKSHEVLDFAKKKLGYEMLLDICSLDHFGQEPRFTVVYELATVNDSKHLRVKVAVSEEQEIVSVCDVWAGANWHEREVYDMMGIRFANHPDLRRILMWEGYPFYPLRKDFPLAGRPSDMPDVASTDVAPLEGGPFVTCSGGEDTIRREPRARVLE